MVLSFAQAHADRARPEGARQVRYNFGVKGVRSVEHHKRRLKRGENFPPFLYISVISSCQLRCQGCWVDVAAPSADRCRSTT